VGCSENRRETRNHCTLSVQIHAPSEDVLLFTYATNISKDGIFVRANRPLPVGVKVHLDLQPQQPGERVHLDGVVVHVGDGSGQPRGMGVSFTDLGDGDSEALRQLMGRANMRSMLTVGDAETYTAFNGSNGFNGSNRFNGSNGFFNGSNGSSGSRLSKTGT
jgi:uncharacterized protein (TIGR02266 family)